MRESLHQTRQAFPGLIQASWRRCRDEGMLPRTRAPQDPLPKTQLVSKQDRSRELRRFAVKEMQILEHALGKSGRILLVADADGTILDAQGDSEFLGRARRVSLVPGACWGEQTVGTNAIGTSILAQQFVQVIGAQHFCYENRFLTCNAMPVRSPEGHLAGVLNISGDVCSTYSSAPKLVRHAVAHIEHDWALHAAKDLVVRLHRHPSWLRTSEEGVLTFTDGLVTGASPRALHLLRLSPSAIGAARWEDLFEQRSVLGVRELRLSTSELLYADVERVRSRAVPVPVQPETLSTITDLALRQALSAARGNVSDAARRLGIHRSTLYRRLQPTQS